MKKTLAYEVTIAAPRGVVWDKLTAPDTYREWTAAFAPGSHYQGSWDQGAEIRFLAPNGDGMVSEIAENPRHAFIRIRHLGEIANGQVDRTSERVRAWAPADETYTFTESPQGTHLRATVETAADWEEHMNTSFPKALQRLKELCEAA